jgi:mannose-6-phosphate isomerase-like protein (cupin superfamily)
LANNSLPDFISRPLAALILSPEGADLVIAEWTAPGCPPDETPELIAPLHIHHNDDEAWYVLEGTLGFQIGDAKFEANVHDAVVAPRGMKHTYWNPKPVPARYLIVMTAQISALIDAIHSTEQRDPESMKKLFEQHGCELVE